MSYRDICVCVECDILVNEKSVSRKHAELDFQFQVEQVEDVMATRSIYLIDKSKFGTFVNGAKCKTPKQLLQAGDEIRFGVNVECTYSMCYEPFVIFWDPDSLASSTKSLVRKQVATLGMASITTLSVNSVRIRWPSLQSVGDLYPLSTRGRFSYSSFVFDTVARAPLLPTFLACCC